MFRRQTHSDVFHCILFTARVPRTSNRQRDSLEVVAAVCYPVAVAAAAAVGKTVTGDGHTLFTWDGSFVCVAAKSSTQHPRLLVAASLTTFTAVAPFASVPTAEHRPC